ncbi:MAG: hypothetical protein LBG59_09500 [Candidatus Peribacteria bacterium]|jgi:hypothetical protein|nr:hypothetical protein [Candidatus Peribacteria bacterium]
MLQRLLYGLVLIVLTIPTFSFAQENNRKDPDPDCIERADNGACALYCKGIKLNTDVPFIGDCIELGQKTGETGDRID